MFSGCGLPFKRRNALAGRSSMNVRTLIGESVHRAEDFRFLKGTGALRRRSQARGHAARGGAAQPRGAWPHPQDRCVGGARHAGRACGHDRGGDRRQRAGHPAAARQPAGVQELPAAGHRQRQGALCRRAHRGGGRGEPGRGRGRAGGDRGRYRAAAGAGRSACGGGRPIAAVRAAAATARCATRRRSAMPMRLSPRRNTRGRKRSAATG